MTLNEKEKRFCEEYVKLGEKRQASILAGYAEKSAAVTASRLLKKDNILQYIDELHKKMASDRILSAEQALGILSDIALGKATEEVVVATKDNVQVVQKTPSNSDRVRAASEIMKRYPLPIDINIAKPTEIKLVLGAEMVDAEEPEDE